MMFTLSFYSESQCTIHLHRHADRDEYVNWW